LTVNSSDSGNRLTPTNFRCDTPDEKLQGAFKSLVKKNVAATKIKAPIWCVRVHSGWCWWWLCIVLDLLLLLEPHIRFENEDERRQWCGVKDANAFFYIDYFLKTTIIKKNKVRVTLKINRWPRKHTKYRTENESSQIEYVRVRLDLIKINSVGVQHKLFLWFKFDSFKVHEQFNSTR